MRIHDFLDSPSWTQTCPNVCRTVCIVCCIWFVHE